MLFTLPRESKAAARAMIEREKLEVEGQLRRQKNLQQMKRIRLPRRLLGLLHCNPSSLMNSSAGILQQSCADQDVVMPTVKKLIFSLFLENYQKNLGL